MVYAGVDVHRKRSQVSLVDGDGKELLNRNVDNGSDAMLEILEDLEPGTPVAFEAAYGWGWLADLLEESELEAHLVHPSACKAIASARLKNDKVDARMLAHLLRTDLLPEAWVAPKEVGDIKRFPTARKLCAWAGLTPSVRNSDTKVRHGHITKAGPASVRWVLTEASYHARRFPPFAATFEAMTKRRGKHIAGVAVCRKLLARAFHILKSLEAAQVQ